MCLTVGVTILASKPDIPLLLSYQCTVGAIAWSDVGHLRLAVDVLCVLLCFD